MPAATTPAARLTGTPLRPCPRGRSRRIGSRGADTVALDRVTDLPPEPEEVGHAQHAPEPVDVVLRVLSSAANHGKLWFGIAAVGVLAGGRSRRAGIRGVGSLAVASFTANSLVKPLVGRRRPDIERTHLARRIGSTPWTSSFPSGHSASAAAFATAAALELPASALVLAPVAAAVATSGSTSACTTAATSSSGRRSG